MAGRAKFKILKMALSWNEIKDRALKFSNEWKDEISEDAEAKTFWDGFFNVFGISRRRVASFEHYVKKLNGKQGFVDLFWPGMLLVEHKSLGKSLEKAFAQAIDYFPALDEKELPRYITVSDFARFRLYDFEEDKTHEFTLADFTKNVHLFGFVAGYQKRTYKEEDPVNIQAAIYMGKLHDKLKAIGYEGHRLELYLVRLVFCLFADDTGIFEKDTFREFVELYLKDDGKNLGQGLAHFFEVLNLPKDKRLKNLDEVVNNFPYVNGKLFEEHLGFASFDKSMRDILFEACQLDWGQISPAIFGSLFQCVMSPEQRLNFGAHYTSEKNILKLIKSLFLDELWKEFESVKDSLPRLKKFHKKIGQLRFLDPACGCGNFLVITYRELRLLEIEIIKVQLFKFQKIKENAEGYVKLDIDQLVQCNVDRFYGIEYEEFPSQIAQVALWLTDHQMNMKVSEAFGEYYVRLPLRKSPYIIHGNSLEVDWQSIIVPYSWEKKEAVYDYILGNPPFRGKQLQNAEQKTDMEKVFHNVHGAGVLDYVAAWYLKAAQYVQKTKTEVAFVSTNSISQGEQAGVLWNELYHRYKIKIHFAHRTFKWSNEAKGNAAVHVVIIGFANFDTEEKYIFEYDNINAEPHGVKVTNINPYLVEGKDICIPGRSKPICRVPSMVYGSKPVDDGNLFFNDEEKKVFLKQEPKAKKYFRPILSSHDYINGVNRWCLWLEDANPSEIAKMPLIIERLNKIKKFRLDSIKASVREQALTPSLFSEIRQPKNDYVIIPRHSSELRKYIPFGFFDIKTIVSDSCTALPNASLYHFGVLTSEIHMAWVRYVCGRIKSDFRYSNTIVYNNFPWPENPSEKQVKAVEKAAEKVLEVRKEFPESSLADLYDPLTMPPALVKAHQALDKAVDLCYRPQPFVSETKRIEFLFDLYDKYTAGLFPVLKIKGYKKPPKPKPTIAKEPEIVYGSQQALEFM